MKDYNSEYLLDMHLGGDESDFSTDDNEEDDE